MNVFYPYPSYDYNGKIIKFTPSKDNFLVFDKNIATDFETLLNDTSINEIFLPVDIDTEFQTFNFFNEKLFFENLINTLTLTAQIKPVNYHHDETVIFNNHKFVSLFPDLKKFDVYKDNLFESFLNLGCKDLDLKFKFECYSNQDRKHYRKHYKKIYDKVAKKKKLTIVIYGHFLLADFYKIFNGNYLANILEDSTGKHATLIKDKRFRVKDDRYYKPYWFITHIATGEKIPVEFIIIDQSSIYGDASRSLVAMFKSLSIDTTTKTSLTQQQKENIINTYQYVFDAFVEYAKNDCRIHECLLKVIEQHFKLYEDLGIESEKPPTLTLGATTKNTFIEKLKSMLGDEKVIDNIKDNSTKQLSKNLSKTLALNAIVNGGRAFNSSPLTFMIKSKILDWDVMSAYVINMLIQDNFKGKCEYYDSSKQPKLKLKTFLEKHGHNFTDRSFQIIVSGELTANQNYFISNELPNKWYDLPDYSHIQDEDKLKELMGIKIDGKEYTKQELKQLQKNREIYNLRGDWCQDKSVSRKIFANQLLNSIITFDGLMWINNHATPQLRKDILNCDVVTAMWYDKSKEVDDYSKLNGNNWYRLTLGEVMINEVFKNRKKYDKHNPLEKPMNNVFKYLGNSLNGDLMSVFFDISNPIVSNNVCARTRHSTWLGQSIGTQQIITDGGFIDLLNVLYPTNIEKNKLNSEIVCYHQHLKDTKGHYKLKPLGNIKSIRITGETSDVEITFNDSEILSMNMNKARKYFDDLLLTELRNIFPYDHLLNEQITLPHNNSVINGIAFESKGIVTTAISHGQANYAFSGGYHENFNSNGVETKMRSYCLKFRKVRDVLNEFLSNLTDNPTKVKRSKPFLMTQIISPKIYSVRKEFFEDKNLIIGDTLYKVCFFKECSLSSFHFRNIEQYQNFIKKQQSFKNKYGQSFEMFFENEDETLNYEEMMNYIYELIYAGKQKFIKPKNKQYKEHKYYKEYKRLKWWCDNEYASKNQTIFLEDLIKEFDFEIIDTDNTEIIKVDSDLKNDFDLDDLLEDLMIA